MITLASVAYADQCPDTNPNSNNNSHFTGAGLLGGGGVGQITCDYADFSKYQMQGTYQVDYSEPSITHWYAGEGDFGGYCGDFQGFVHPVNYCQFIKEE